MDNYNFIMMGRSVDGRNWADLIVWVKGTIQAEEKDKDSIAKLLKESIKKVLELATDNAFQWKNVCLMEQGNEVPKGINIEDLFLWKWCFDYGDESYGTKEFHYTAQKIEELNSKLSKL